MLYSFIIIYLLFFIIVYSFSLAKGKHITKENNENIEKIDIDLNNQINCVSDILRCKFNGNSYEYKLEIPVFILNKDRLYALEIILARFFQLQRLYKIKIYVLDHFTTYAPTIEYLNKLVYDGKITLIKLAKSNWYDMIGTELPKLISEITKKSNYEYYILTDSDIILDYIPDDFIYFYIHLLNSCLGIDVIGPHISVTSISNDYPKSVWAYKIEIAYAAKTHYDIFWRKGFFSIVESPIDTTFQIRRSNKLFVRLVGKMFRSLPPYSILHTDYYLSPAKFPKSYQHYVNRSGDINHSYWN